jgi:hypothetical protein
MLAVAGVFVGAGLAAAIGLPLGWLLGIFKPKR